MITVEYETVDGKWNYTITRSDQVDKMYGFGFPSKKQAKRTATWILGDIRKKETVRVKR